MRSGNRLHRQPIPESSPERLRPWRRSEPVLTLVWLLGALGFFGPLILARHSAHADVLRAIALGWFIGFGVLNAYLILRQGLGRGR